MDRLPSGMVRYSAPDSMHDDCVMSFAMAWHGATLAQRPRQGQRNTEMIDIMALTPEQL